MTLVCNRSRLASGLELTALALLVVPVTTVVAATVGFAVHLPISPWLLGVAVLMSLTVVRVRSGCWRTFFLVSAAVFVVHGVGLAYGIAVSDESWDGLWYHQEAIIQLADGWNPIYQDTRLLGTPEHAALWIDHYPKAAWIAAAPWFQATGRIDSGKVIAFTMLCSAACMAAATLLWRTTLSVAVVAWLAVIMATNPVFVYQSTTLEADGILACLLLVLMTSLVGFLPEKAWPRLWPGWLALMLLANLKFTGLAYGGVFVAVAAVVTVAWWGLRTGLKLATAGALVAAVSVCALGYAPYVRNLREHGSALYPLAGPEAYDITTPDRPVNLADQDRVTRFLISTFSRTGNNMAPRSTELKWPLSIDESELTVNESLTGGGFGPLYGAAFIAACVLLVVLGASRSSPQRHAIWIVLLATLASVFVHAETWWMRYVPQAWWLPSLVGLAALLEPSRIRRALGKALLIMLSVNLAIVCVAFARSARAYINDTRQYLQELRAAPKPVYVYLHAFPGFRAHLREAGIAYVEIPPPAYSSAREDLLARDYLPPEPTVPVGVVRHPVYPHQKVFWYTLPQP